MFRWFVRAAFAVLAMGAVQSSAQEQAPLSAESFTREPAIWSATLSPDGRSVAAIQRSSQGDVLTIIDWRTRTAQITQLARTDRNLRLDWVAWKNDNRVVFSLTQEPVIRNQRIITEGSTRVYAANRDGSNATLMEAGGARHASAYAPIFVIDLLRNVPDEILLGSYSANGFAVYRANIGTGRVTSLVDFGEYNTAAMYVDSNGYPVMRVDYLTDNSGLRIYRRSPRQRDWTLAHEIRRSSASQNRFFEPLGSGPGPGQVYVAARSEGEEFQSIYLYDTATGNLGNPVFRHEGADVAVVWFDRNDHSVVVGCGEMQRWDCRAMTPDRQSLLDALRRHLPADVDIALQDVTADENFWLVSAHGPRSPASYYVYDRQNDAISFLASTQPQITAQNLAPMRIVDYASRDGTRLWGYLTEPTTPGPHPLVVFPHGGPESRDSYSYDFFVQYLAWRGYAVFQPNFRGSEGSGRSFATAGYRQWGRRMQDDISDGVQDLIANGVVDRDRICIVGASYGGYAALAGVTLTPDLYRCAISIAGVSDLVEMLNHERSEEGRGSAAYSYWLQVIGDPSANRDELIAVSPARHAADVRVPVLLIHGEDDSIVPFEQSEIMRDALNSAGSNTQLIEIEDEGHIWGAWSREHRQRLLEETDRFLAQHLAR
ncbi:MAG: S9 family peptidase [Caulobacteraceae bacterium]|nr:S9 family peptidase [Caulobacteraceae bacterium]